MRKNLAHVNFRLIKSPCNNALYAKFTIRYFSQIIEKTNKIIVKSTVKINKFTLIKKKEL